MASNAKNLLPVRPTSAGMRSRVGFAAALLCALAIGAFLLTGCSGSGFGEPGAGAGIAGANGTGDDAEASQASGQEASSAFDEEEVGEGSASDEPGVNGESAGGGAGVSGESAGGGAAVGAASAPYDIDPKDMAAVKNKKGKVFTFVLGDEGDGDGASDGASNGAGAGTGSGNGDGDGSDSASATASAPTLSADDRAVIQKAIDKVEAAGDSVGFVLIDVNTGAGLGYNINQKIYGASSIKASAVAWVLQNYVDKGKAQLSASYPSGIYNDQGNLTVTGSKKLSALMKNALVNSDNADYLALRNDFDLKNYAKWLEANGVDGSVGTDDTDYPHYSAKQAACMWLNMADYMREGSGNAQKLAGWLSGTKFSFLRKALAKEEGVGVLNKAGWSAIPPAYYGTCDNGYITVRKETAAGAAEAGAAAAGAAEADAAANDAAATNGAVSEGAVSAGAGTLAETDAYVLCIVTSAPGYADYSNGSSKRIMAVAKAVFAARECLG